MIDLTQDKEVQWEFVNANNLIAGLKKANIDVDRRVLADLAVHDKAAFTAIVDQAKTGLAA